ncbi:hypothetical protein BaRGS_00017109 [Batillaria attramentaria]|uniref:Uncharacterized protein n=1 Tax=Batillaria attramentaria TaxID=370345 RepID=A0ABD0KX69_9CAEN
MELRRHLSRMHVRDAEFQVKENRDILSLSISAPRQTRVIGKVIDSCTHYGFVAPHRISASLKLDVTSTCSVAETPRGTQAAKTESDDRDHEFWLKKIEVCQAKVAITNYVHEPGHDWRGGVGDKRVKKGRCLSSLSDWRARQVRRLSTTTVFAIPKHRDVSTSLEPLVLVMPPGNESQKGETMRKEERKLKTDRRTQKSADTGGG